MDLSILKDIDNNGKESIKGCWERMLMKISPNPYMVTKDMLVIKREIRGKRLDEKNIFRLNIIFLNLPNMKDYNPTRPWVYKVRSGEKIVTGVFWYIDDGRITTLTAWECWKTACKVCYTLTHILGSKIKEQSVRELVRHQENGREPCWKQLTGKRIY